MTEPAHARPMAAWVPLAVLAGAGAYLKLHWDDIPERWVVHWGAGAMPNGWAVRTWFDVYALLLGGVALWVLFEGVAAIVRATGRGNPTMEPLAGATVHMLRLVSLASAVLLGFLAVTLPLGPHVGPGMIVLLTVALLGGAIALGAARAAQAMRRVKAQHPERLKGYRGLVYHDREDPRLWVPKVLGIGWTINYAHPLAWPVTLLLFGTPLAVMAAGLLLGP